MVLLGFLWNFALSLTAVSVLGMTILIAARPIRGWRERRVGRSRAIILQVLVDPDISARKLRRHVMRMARLGALAPIILEVLAIVRGSARKSFVEQLTDAGTARALRESLLYGKSRDRRCAAEALAAFAPFEAEAALQRAWWDADPRVRFAAIRASIEIDLPPAFTDVLRIANQAGARDLAPALGLARLMATRFPRAARVALVEAALPSHTRVALIEGLAISVDVLSIEALLVTSLDPCPAIRAAAMLAIGRCPGSVGLAAVVRGLGDGDWMVRANAAAAAGKARLTTCEPLLRLLTRDEHWWVRLRAGEALERLSAMKGKVIAA